MGFIRIMNHALSEYQPINDATFYIAFFMHIGV